MTPVNPRSITKAERPWIEHWSDEAHRILFRQVRERHGARTSRNLCSYIATRAIGEDPEVSGTAKADYRNILAELAHDGICPPPNGRRKLVAVTPRPYTKERRTSQGVGGGSFRSTPTPAALTAIPGATMTMQPVETLNPRSITDLERRFFDVDPVELAAAVFELGFYGNARAREVAAWVAMKAREDADGQRLDTASEIARKGYRRILQRLLEAGTVNGVSGGYVNIAAHCDLAA